MKTLSGGAQIGHSGTKIYNPEDKLKVEEVKNWIKSHPKNNDLVTEYNQIHGFEHPIVVVFQDDDPAKYELNICMRATSYLVVVEMPTKQHRSLCFGKCPDDDDPGIDNTENFTDENWYPNANDDVIQHGRFMIYRRLKSDDTENSENPSGANSLDHR